jgi:ATP-dependent Zn protease
LVILAVVLGIGSWFAWQWFDIGAKENLWSYSQLMHGAADHQVSRVVVSGTTASATTQDGSRHDVNLGDSTDSVVRQLSSEGVRVSREPGPAIPLPQVLWSLLIGLLVGGSIYYAVRRWTPTVQVRGAPRRPLSPVAIVVLVPLLLVVALSVLFWFSWQSIESGSTGRRWSYSELTSTAAAHHVSRLVIGGTTATATSLDGSQHVVDLPGSTSSLASQLSSDGVDVSYQQSDTGAVPFGPVVTGEIFLLLLGGFVYALARRRSGRLSQPPGPAPPPTSPPAVPPGTEA